jgi:hypothetical protein
MKKNCIYSIVLILVSFDSRSQAFLFNPIEDGLLSLNFYKGWKMDSLNGRVKKIEILKYTYGEEFGEQVWKQSGAEIKEYLPNGDISGHSTMKIGLPSENVLRKVIFTKDSTSYFYKSDSVVLKFLRCSSDNSSFSPSSFMPNGLKIFTLNGSRKIIATDVFYKGSLPIKKDLRRNYKYDDENRLIEVKVFNLENDNPLDRIWKIYYENTKIVLNIFDSGGNILAKFIILLNSKGQIGEQVYFQGYKGLKKYRSQKYKYELNKIKEITDYDHGEYVEGNYKSSKLIYKNQFLTKKEFYTFKRSENLEDLIAVWEYKNDMFGNWIEFTFSNKRYQDFGDGDFLKPYEKYVRKITYYK